MRPFSNVAVVGASPEPEREAVEVTEFHITVTFDNPDEVIGDWCSDFLAFVVEGVPVDVHVITADWALRVSSSLNS